MKKEVKNYIKNVTKSESFVVDLITSILSVIIIGLIIFTLFNPKVMGMFKYIFVLAAIVAIINSAKSFRLNSPTRFMYLIFAGISIVAAVYCFIRL